MPDYERAARKAAKRYGIDPDIFVAQLRQESGLRPGQTSSAGAQGIAQFIPSTAKQYGVNLNDGRVGDDLDGAARYMRDSLDRTGDDYKAALSIYNSGRPDAYKDPNFAGGQTYNYVRTILGSAKPRKLKANQRAGSVAVGPQSTTTVTTPGVDNSGLRRQAVGQFLQQGGVRNQNAVLSLAGAYGQLGDTAATTSTYSQPQPKGQTPALNTGAVGATAALSWAKSKVGAPGSKESGGENRGGLADYANSRFGMSGQPWCAMFTSMAVTKGGAPKTARTASVAEVRRQAEQGGGGYQRGFVKRARPGDLILFGNDHVGMVDHVSDGKVWFVGGNQSDNVTLSSVPVGGGDIVRPKYGARRKR